MCRRVTEALSGLMACVCAVYDKQVLVFQNDLARLRWMWRTSRATMRLEQAMRLPNEEFNDKMQIIGKYEVCPPEPSHSLNCLLACLLACWGHGANGLIGWVLSRHSVSQCGGGWL